MPSPAQALPALGRPCIPHPLSPPGGPYSRGARGTEGRLLPGPGGWEPEGEHSPSFGRQAPSRWPRVCRFTHVARGGTGVRMLEATWCQSQVHLAWPSSRRQGAESPNVLSGEEGGKGGTKPAARNPSVHPQATPGRGLWRLPARPPPLGSSPVTLVSPAVESTNRGDLHPQPRSSSLTFSPPAGPEPVGVQGSPRGAETQGSG